uniref:Csu type fimbrial protein n=1 Tax=Sphingomonas sp. GlSt437 TaxID=3389970 RepID=UPI003A83F117
MAFGSYDPTSAVPLDASTTLLVTCTTGTVYTVALGVGGGTGATVAVRKMRNGANELHYALYQDSARTTLWGNTPGTDTPAAATASVTPATLTVYGRVAASQNVPAGTYTDAVTVTVTY